MKVKTVLVPSMVTAFSMDLIFRAFSGISFTEDSNAVLDLDLKKSVEVKTVLMPSLVADFSIEQICVNFCSKIHEVSFTEASVTMLDS